MPRLRGLIVQRIRVVFGAVLVGVMVYPSASLAQDLVDGTWSGTMTPPNAGGEVALEYEVTHPEGKLAIVMASPMGWMPFSNIEFSDGMLRFTWQPGPVVECQLEPQVSGGYYGDCIDETGGTGQLRMVPPAQTE
jgi:hypothetical protein